MSLPKGRPAPKPKGSNLPFTPIRLNHPEFAAEITFSEGTSLYSLNWNDGVANEWTEEYPSLDMALGRLAVLVLTVETERTFTQDAAEFAAAWPTMTAEVCV